MLNDGQLAAIEKLNCWIKEPRQNKFILNGAGGTGKTTVIGEFLKQLVSRGWYKPSEVVLTAPTHNAVNNICEGLLGFNGYTIHKLLGFRPAATETERQILVKVGGADSLRIIEEKIVVVDEAYYCPAILMKTAFENYPDVKWIFLGDPGQLPPVEESKSFLLSMESEVHYKHTLTENMRAGDKEQAKLMQNVRDFGWDADLVVTSKAKAQAKMMNMVTGFNFLSFHHRIVNETASFIRHEVLDYDYGSPPQPGELIRVSGVKDIVKYDITRTNELVTVIAHQSNSLTVQRTNGLITKLPIDDNGTVNKLKITAIKSRDRKDWAKYHTVSKQYVTVFSSRASTVHSYQGMTTPHAIIDLSDLKSCAIQQLLYVAISRSQTLPTLYY